jgi:hypothetical protein
MQTKYLRPFCVKIEPAASNASESRTGSRPLNPQMRAIPSLDAIPGTNYSRVINPTKSHVRLLLGPMEWFE